MKIAILVSWDLLQGLAPQVELSEYQDELQKLQQAFAEYGMGLEPVWWQDGVKRAAEFDAMLPLFVWDYFDGNRTRFLAEMRDVSAVTQLFNTAEIIQWNSDKSYLEDLSKRDVGIVKTLETDAVDLEFVEQTFQQFGCDQVVIKPKVGGGAWRQVLYSKGDAWPEPEALPPETALIQPFLASIQSEGEYSFLYFEGQFSHALVKRPQPGDYRIQAAFGGIESAYRPTENELRTAGQILAALEFEPLYARVDLIRDDAGRLRLMELELIEPYLYLEHSKVEAGVCEGARMLAAALKRRLA